MLSVSLGVEREVRSGRLVAREAVVLDKPAELRAGHIGLSAVDRVQHGPRLQLVLPSPGGCALARLRRRLAVEGCVERGRELVPQLDVGGLLGGVACIARPRGGISECDDGMPVLAGVERELGTRELTALPAEIERMLEDGPACASLIDELDQIHLAPSGDRTP